MEEFKLNIGRMNCERLCEIIVSFRYCGALKEEAIFCMQELARRRELGSDFIFENFIQEKLKNLPPFKQNIKLQTYNIASFIKK